ncbi:MAG: heme lyase CcmF/NrfE family subunit [bacterium]
MIAEFAHFSLIIACCLAALQIAIPLLGAAKGNNLWMRASRSLATGQFVFVFASFLVLCWLFVTDDFSVAYVAANSNSLLPIQYKISAVWGAHEGSLLLWVLILAGWTVAVAALSRSLPLTLVARVISVMGMISMGFYLFTLLTSNPFLRLLPFPPLDGGDLNPLLQDFGLIVHPPMLYMGYVGLSVAFAFAIAALLEGRVDAAWSRWVRPWTTIAWMFLTLGIALGSWWAYYELGWGGWWFWDPVENASFMPWLVGTALVHSLAVSEKRGIFRSWTLLLAIFAFSLSLLGTFLVRSGVLTSVHAFASDPERGVFILAFLFLVIGGSLTLYGIKGGALKGVGRYSGLSRESLLLVNNIVLVIAAGIILLGTIYPLLVDVISGEKLSVGPPYFNLFFVPLTLFLGAVVAFGAVVNWKRHAAGSLIKVLRSPALLAIAFAAAFPFLYGGSFHTGVFLAVAVSSWILFAAITDIRHKTRNASSLTVGLRKMSASYYAMHIAHIGLAASILGVGLTSVYSVEYDKRLIAGDEVTIQGYRFLFGEVEKVKGPNYVADRGDIQVFSADRQVASLHPEKRRYIASGQVMTEAAIDAGLFRDLYVSLAEPLPDGAWAVRIYVKPFVRWVWLGALLASLGGVIATLDKRYRRRVANTRSIASAGVVEAVKEVTP